MKETITRCDRCGNTIPEGEVVDTLRVQVEGLTLTTKAMKTKATADLCWECQGRILKAGLEQAVQRVAPSAGAATLSVSAPEADAGTKGAIVTVVLDAFAPVRSAQMVMRFDPDELEVKAVSAAERVVDAGFGPVDYNVLSVGEEKELRIAVLSTDSDAELPEGEGHLVDVTLDVAKVPARIHFVEKGEQKTRVFRNAASEFEVETKPGRIAPARAIARGV